MGYEGFLKDTAVGDFIAHALSEPFRYMGRDMEDILNAFVDAAGRPAMQLDGASVDRALQSVIPRMKKSRLKDSPGMIAEFVRFLAGNGLANGQALAKAAEARANALCREDEAKRLPVKNDGGEIGRNDPCPCGSGKKYKKCCEAKAQGARG